MIQSLSDPFPPTALPRHHAHDYVQLVKTSLNPEGHQNHWIQSYSDLAGWWRICLLVELHRKGSAPACISKHGTLDKDNRGNNFLEDTGGIISYLRDNRFCELRPYWMDKMTLKRDETITMTWAWPALSCTYIMDQILYTISWFIWSGLVV